MPGAGALRGSLLRAQAGARLTGDATDCAGNAVQTRKLVKA
jgi:hypothetical protein